MRVIAAWGGGESDSLIVGNGNVSMLVPHGAGKRSKMILIEMSQYFRIANNASWH